MILILVLVGFLIGASAAAIALIGGGGILAALAAYGLFGVGAIVVSAVLLAFGPVWPRRQVAPVADVRPR